MRHGIGVRGLAIDPSDSHIVWAGTTAPDKLYRSTNKGDTWQFIKDFGTISEIAVHPGNGDIVYLASAYTGVFRTLDGGLTWTQLTLGAPSSTIMRVMIAPGYPVRLFIITLNGGILRLVDEEIPRSMIRQ
jgi:hypothetical protein